MFVAGLVIFSLAGVLAGIQPYVHAAETGADWQRLVAAAKKEGKVVIGAPHPNAAKVFFNWLLSREGQELHNKTAQQPSRRLDVDTKGLDGQAAKDALTVEEFRRLQNFTEDKCNNSWLPGAKLAEAVLK